MSGTCDTLSARCRSQKCNIKNTLHQLQHDIIYLMNREIVAITDLANDKVNDRELPPSSSCTVVRCDKQDVRGDFTGGGVAVLMK